jgi:hypothetical protein
MRDISILAQTPVADLDRFAAIESMIAKGSGAGVVTTIVAIRHEGLIAR